MFSQFGEIENYIQLFQLCLALYSFYRECYDETQKEMMEAADERPFDCSEMYIFGKFETFRKRLVKVSCIHIYFYKPVRTWAIDRNVIVIFLTENLFSKGCLEEFALSVRHLSYLP